MHHFIFVLSILALLAAAPGAYAADKSNGGFFLRDGDTVVFYGDSITEQLYYGQFIENYVISRFPKMHVKFINSGWGGDRVNGGGGGDIDTRLKRDVLPYKPTVVTVCLGMNDLFLGMRDFSYPPEDKRLFEMYAKGITHIVDFLTQNLPKARLTLLTPTMHDLPSALDPSVDIYNQQLVKFGDFVKQLGAQRGILVVDVNAPLVAATVKGRQADPKFTLVPDDVHPDAAGYLVIAAAVLQAWHAPTEPEEIELTPGGSTTMTTKLPWPVSEAALPAFAVSPTAASFNSFRIRVKQFPETGSEAQFKLSVDGKEVAALTREQLLAGVDLTQYHDFPLNQQAREVDRLTRLRLDKWHSLWKLDSNAQPPANAIAQPTDQPTPEQIKVFLAIDHWLDEWRMRAQQAARPQSHTFTLRAAAP